MNISIIINTLVICFCQIFGSLKAAQILAILGIPHPAENVFASTLLNTLNERGHKLTVINRFSHEIKLHKDINKIVIDENDETYTEFLLFSTENFDKTLLPNLQKFFAKGALITPNIINNRRVQEIMEQKQFHLLIIDTLMSEALYGLGEHFNAPMIGVSNYFNTESLDMLVGNVSPLSIIPSIFIQHTFEGTFMQRCLNVALNVFDKLTYNYLYLPHQRRLYKEMFPNATLTFDQAKQNFSLVLLNQHFSLNFPRPYVPNMIEVAGLHIEDNTKMLPLNVQQFLDDSKQDIIYVHSNNDMKILNLMLKVTKYNNYLILVLFRALKTLNFNVIWHMDGVPPEGLEGYSNILQVSNISHYSLLAHPRVKLFITNGDIQCIIDAVHFSKPILGMPLFADQHINMNLVTTAGYGLSIKFKNLTEVKLKNDILEIVNNPCYLQKITQLSKIFRDQPIKPKDKAVYWIEYVLRHGGAMHLRSKGRFLNFWQFNNIDVFVAYLVSFLVIVFIIWLLLRFFCLLVYRNKKNLRIKFKKN